jgi:hypothetical protein
MPDATHDKAQRVVVEPEGFVSGLTARIVCNDKAQAPDAAARAPNCLPCMDGQHTDCYADKRPTVHCCECRDTGHAAARADALLSQCDAAWRAWLTTPEVCNMPSAGTYRDYDGFRAGFGAGLAAMRDYVLAEAPCEICFGRHRGVLIGRRHSTEHRHVMPAWLKAALDLEGGTDGD